MIKAEQLHNRAHKDLVFTAEEDLCGGSRSQFVLNHWDVIDIHQEPAAAGLNPSALTLHVQDFYFV